MALGKTPLCDHRWIRDDQNTKQCFHCKSYAPIREDDNL